MEFSKIFLGGLIILSALLISEGSKAQNETNFKTVKTGRQEWMAENLNVSVFRNGDPIPEAKTFMEFKNAGINGKPAWCYYNNDSLNGKKYGKLYNWFAVNDPRGLAPTGWQIPGSSSWNTLILYLGGDSIAGLKMKSSSGWKENGNGDNTSGFNGLPGGYCDLAYTGLGESGVWWAGGGGGLSGRGTAFFLTYLNKSISGSGAKVEFGFPVRCLKD